ncbi:glycoside hydrolase family 32 protein [Novipirellula artificiosorum]|uniref:Levanase n=1 Tax=Novipirellula artificiosorum TaxID=2528016 RepID=A0A5C6DAV1_9BACT|nr:glycoside hydrolase family 32 protein [Novipirellula artificiosorum]TWU31989.1 Levanase precursor [Novipirellula artificiosorum]
MNRRLSPFSGRSFLYRNRFASAWKLANGCDAAVGLVICFSLLLFVFVTPSVGDAQDDILINSFETANYGEWRVEGEAFGTSPAQGTLPGQMQVTGFEGKGLVNSYLGGDKSKGKLTSPEFTIERDFIKFLIGGGGHEGKTCINLIIAGEIVQSATGPNLQPGGSEFLNWENWDVQDRKGQKAILQIVDDSSGGWGHINVDQILQSHTKTVKRPAPATKEPANANPHPETTKELKITGKYILFPVSNKGQRGRMTVYVGDQLVHNLDCDFPASQDSIDWWTYLDMSEYVGKTAKIIARAAPEICEMWESNDEIRHLQPLYQETLRPQFHISQMRGWNNDPNGMFYHDGQYHFFWQCNPAGRDWANMYWGYATSRDMVHWTEHDRALRPFGGDVENRHPKMAVKNCFSGSGNIDFNNTAGWQTGDEKTMVLAFTDTGCGESLAYSTDRGTTWTVYEGNPVIEHKGRDPKLMWYEPGKHWVIAVYDEQPEQGRSIAIYTSKDLKEWKLASNLPGYFECAEIFELPVDGDPTKTKWVIFAADAKYALGEFDGNTFTPEHEGKHQVHWGSYYASQCFSNSPDGRVVQVGWARINMPDMPFNQTFSVPTNLTLRTTEDGVRMFANPIKELEGLRKLNPNSVENKKLTRDTPVVKFDVTDQLFDIVVTLKNGNASKAKLKFGENVATYDFDAQKLDEMPLKTQDGRVTFRILVDRPMFEMIGADGACFKTSSRRDMGQPIGEVSLSAEGGSLTVESLVVYEMTSVW